MERNGISLIKYKKADIKMIKDDFIYIPHNFAELSNENIIEQHDLLFKNSNYSQAVNLLNQNPQVDGMRASLFNEIEEKIIYLDKLFDGKEKPELIIYKTTEPNEAEFNNKVIWAQEYL